MRVPHNTKLTEMNQAISNFCCSSFSVGWQLWSWLQGVLILCNELFTLHLTHSSLSCGTGQDCSRLLHLSPPLVTDLVDTVGVAYVQWSISHSASSWSSVVRQAAAVDCSFSSFARSTSFGLRRYLQEKSQSPFLSLILLPDDVRYTYFFHIAYPGPSLAAGRCHTLFRALCLNRITFPLLQVVMPINQMQSISGRVAKSFF